MSGWPTLASMNMQALIEKAGGVVDLATLSGVARTTVLDWKRTGLLPANRISRISDALSVPIEDLVKLTSQRGVVEVTASPEAI